jgi:Protein of unknown function (DUF3253)
MAAVEVAWAVQRRGERVQQPRKDRENGVPRTARPERPRGTVPGEPTPSPGARPLPPLDLPSQAADPGYEVLRRFVLARLTELRAGTTMCPGRLARDAGTRLPSLRPLLEAMQREGQVRVTQGGVEVDLDRARGPFRVSLPCVAGAEVDPAWPGLEAGGG